MVVGTVTAGMLRGTPRSCPICGAPNSTCVGTSTHSTGVRILPRETRRRTGRMKRIDVLTADGRMTTIQVPIFAKDRKEPDDEDDGDQAAKKRPPARDKKVGPPGPAEPQDPARPRPQIRTK